MKKLNRFAHLIANIKKIKKMKIIKFNSIFLLTILSFLSSFLISCESENDMFEENSTHEYEINFEPAYTNSELNHLKSSADVNLIRSSIDFNNIVDNYITPLNKLSEKDLLEFKKTIVYRKDAGVVGFEFESIKRKLSEKDFIKVMSYFGIDMKDGFWPGSLNKAYAMVEYKGYECAAKGTCYENSKAICLDGC